MSNTRAHNFLLVVPVLIALLGIFLSSERGPYYLADNFDPEYNYLLKYLNLLTFHIPAPLLSKTLTAPLGIGE